MTSTGRSLLLDLDGTLAASLEVMREVYEAFMALHGKSGSAEEFAQINGPPLEVFVAQLGRDHALPGGPDELAVQYRQLIETRYLGVRATPGAEDVLAAARTAGWSVAVVTSNDGGLTRRWLERRSLDGFVDAVIGGDSTTRGKPHPEPYLKGLEATGGRPDCSLAVEDSPQGARAAVAAGVPTLAFDPKDGLAGGGPDWPKLQGTLRRLEDLTSWLTPT